MFCDNEVFLLQKQRMGISDVNVIQSLKHYFYKSTSNVMGSSLKALLELPKYQDTR